jgi:YVTN family beta-propeller protein
MYSAPAADRPAGASRLEPVDAILPDGKTAAPFERAIFVGTDPLGLALAPGGRYAIVSNDLPDASLASGAPATASFLRAGYALTVVDTASMRVASVFTAPGLALYCGVAALRDPADPSRTLVLASDGPNGLVRVFDLSSGGTLTAEPASIPVPGYPAAITLSPDGRIAYVTSSAAGTVSTIDVAARSVLHTVPVGFTPFGVARSQNGLYVADGGLQAYQALAQPASAPTFATVSGSPYRSSALSIVPLAANGDAAVTDASTSAVRMDPIPDGVDTVGGAHPGSVVVRRDGRFAYVSLANVDRIATVALSGEPHVVGGLDIRLFVSAPYGTQPDAEALDPNGRRLYVALAGLNAVAVIDSTNPAQLHRLGLIPTGALPSALAISPDGRYLYVTAARGVDGWGLLQRIDLHSLTKPGLVKATLSALRYNRSVSVEKPNAVVPPLRSLRKSNVIDRVVYISVGASTFDGIFGDLGLPDSDPALTAYGESANLRRRRKFLRRFGRFVDRQPIRARRDRDRARATPARRP